VAVSPKENEAVRFDLVKISHIFYISHHPASHILLIHVLGEFVEGHNEGDIAISSTSIERPQSCKGDNEGDDKSVDAANAVEPSKRDDTATDDPFDGEIHILESAVKDLFVRSCLYIQF